MEDRARLIAVLERAREGGAKAAEVLRSRRRCLEQRGSRQGPAHREELSWTVRVWREGGRAGLGVAGTSGEATDLALAASAGAPPDPVVGPAERMPVRTGALGIDDPRHGTLADDDRVEILQLAERALTQNGLKLRDLRYRESREERAWMSTRGVEAAEGATTYELVATVGGGDAEARHRIASRRFADVASLPFGPELRRRIEPLLRPVPAAERRLPLVLEPRAMGDLVRAVAPAFAAGTRSFASERPGLRIASPTLHLTDDAGLFGGLHTRAFDDRGVPPIPVALLKEGVIHGFYHTPEGARALGLRPTGHVVGDVARPSNLIVRPGARTRNVILAELSDYLLLDRVPDVDLTTGVVRGTVPVVRVTRGERIGAFLARMELPLARLLGALKEVAADQERACEVDAPTGVFEGVDLTA